MPRKAKTRSPAVPNNGVCRFEFQDSNAIEVAIAGSFNDWQPQASPMLRTSAGRWMKDLSLPPGRYEYRFVADGIWVDDPHAKETVANPHGGLNAVLVVG